MSKTNKDILTHIEDILREEHVREVIAERQGETLVLRMTEEYKRELAGLPPKTAPSTSVEVER